LLDPQVVLLTILVGLTTGLGALPALFIKGTTQRTRDVLIGFSAGLMLSVTTFNLIPEALGPAQENLPQVGVGILLGALALFVLSAYLPHIHGVLIPDKPLTKGMKTTLILVAVMIMHHFPEGFATGTAYFGGVTLFGSTVALGIALQNIPEGFVISAPLRSQGYSARASFIAGALSGLVEPVSSIVALVVVGAFGALLPYALAFAGGAMLYAIVGEMVPESHSHGFERSATVSLIIGFLLMVVVNYAASLVGAK